jgi:hypothetical protein
MHVNQFILPNLDYSNLAQFMIDQFSRRVNGEYVEYFERRGFTAKNVLEPAILFRFLSCVSYDMRPISFKQIWGPPDHKEFGGNSVREALDCAGVTLDAVCSMPGEDLAEKLESLTVNVRGCPVSLHEINNIDHALGLQQLARRTHTISVVLGDLPISHDVGRLRDTIDDIHGFGEALSAKSVLFLVRCFEIAFREIHPRLLLPIAKGLQKEYWIREGLEILRRWGIDINMLFEELTERRDPFAIEYLYLLENQGDWKRLHDQAFHHV